MMMMMIGVVGALVKVLINSSSKSRAGQLIKSGGRLFHCLGVLGKNECLCASVLEYRMENQFLKELV